MSFRGSGLLAHNLLKVLAYRRARRLVIAALAVLGPQPLRHLLLHTGLTKRRVTRQLADAKAIGSVACHGTRGAAIWALPAQAVDRTAFRRAPTARHTPPVTQAPQPALRSWWVAPDRESFQRAAHERALERGWN